MNTIATAIALDKWVESRHYQRDRLALAQARDHSNSKHRANTSCRKITLSFLSVPPLVNFPSNRKHRTRHVLSTIPEQSAMFGINLHGS